MKNTLGNQTSESLNHENKVTSSFVKKWMTLRQAAYYLGLTVRGLEGYIRRGQVKGYKPFGRWLFDIHELDLMVVASHKRGVL